MTISADHAHTMLLAAARPPAAAILSHMLMFGPQDTLAKLVRDSAPSPVASSIALPPHVLAEQYDALSGGYATLLTSDDDAWPRVLQRPLPDMTTFFAGLWIYGRAPVTTLTGGVALLAEDLPTADAAAAAVNLARDLTSRDIPLLITGFRGISAEILKTVLAVRKPMAGRLVVVVTPQDDVAHMRGSARRLLTRVRAAGGLIVHAYPRGTDFPLDAPSARQIRPAAIQARDRLAGALAAVTVVMAAELGDSPIRSARTAASVDRSVFVSTVASPPSPSTGVLALLTEQVATELRDVDQLATAAQRP